VVFVSCDMFVIRGVCSRCAIGLRSISKTTLNRPDNEPALTLCGSSISAGCFPVLSGSVSAEPLVVGDRMRLTMRPLASFVACLGLSFLLIGAAFAQSD